MIWTEAMFWAIQWPLSWHSVDIYHFWSALLAQCVGTSDDGLYHGPRSFEAQASRMAYKIVGLSDRVPWAVSATSYT